MLTWFQANMGNIVVVLLLAALIFVSVRIMVKNRAKGCSACGSACAGRCGSCPAGDTACPPAGEPSLPKK